MALLGMGANVQCDGYFPGYYSARDVIFESEGSKWISPNVNGELKNDFHRIGSLPAASHNKELLKQTILKHEAVFRDQIHELHRIYHKQRELMEEIKRNELYKHNLRLEASWTGSYLPSKNAQKISCSPNFPWSTGQSSVFISESIQLPLPSGQEKSWQVRSSPAPTVTKESFKDSSKLSEPKYRKVGKKVLDLQLPADEYIDSDDSACLENERVADVRDGNKKPNGTSSTNGFSGLNLQFQFEEAASKSYDLGGPTQHKNNPFYDLSRTTKSGSQNFPNDAIRNLNKGQCDGALDSFPKVIYTEKQFVSVESLRRNVEQFNDPSLFRSLHQVSQPWTERKFSIGESSQGFTGNGLLGPNGASHACAQYKPVSGDNTIISGISPAELWKAPVSDFGRSPIAVQALPFFSTSALMGQSSKSLMGISGFTLDEIQGTSGKSGPNFDNRNFLLSSNDNRGSSDSHEHRMRVKGYKGAANLKNLNLNLSPASNLDTTAFESVQITSDESKFQDSVRGLPWLKEKPVCKGKPSEESKISTQIESVFAKAVEESDLSTEKTLVLHRNEAPQMLSDLQPEVFQNQPKSQRIEEIEKGCVSDVKSDSGKQIPAAKHTTKNEQKKHAFVAGVIDLNSCMIEDENMPMDVDFQAPVSPENKEGSPPRGESDENQLEMPFQLAGQEDPEAQEEQAKVAAEALVSISGIVALNGLQMTTFSSCELFASDPLNWFAGIVSAADHPENETEVDLEEFSPASMDYFEFMTLNLTEVKVLDCCCKTIGQTEQVGGSTSPSQTRKGRTNRGRWRKDFQSEILPSLASLSRYEVTEDLQFIGGLVASRTPSETSPLRSAGRGRKRSYASTANSTDLQLNLKQLSSISWGKTCRKRRGKRVPTTNPLKHILNTSI